MHAVDDGTTYFARTVIYACKMFMKLTAGVLRRQEEGDPAQGAPQLEAVLSQD